MKKIVFLLIAQFVFSQTEKNIGDFQELKVLDGINVVLEKGDKNFLKITGDNTDNVVVLNKSGSLVIRMQLVKKLKGQNTVVKLTHKSNSNFTKQNRSINNIFKNRLRGSNRS